MDHAPIAKEAKIDSPEATFEDAPHVEPTPERLRASWDEGIASGPARAIDFDDLRREARGALTQPAAVLG
jgi:hypothetical protein